MRHQTVKLVIAACVGAAGVFGAVPAVLPPSWTAAVARAQDEQRPVFRGGTAFVYVDVYPRENGMVVEGLTRDDFEITEDGKPQAVETFQFIKYDTVIADDERRDPTSFQDSERQAADPRNRLFVIYLDPYSIKFEDLQSVKPAVQTFLARSIGRSDMFSVMTPEVPVSAMTFARRLDSASRDIETFVKSVEIDGTKKNLPRTPLEERLFACVGGNEDTFVGLLRILREDVLLTSLENLTVRLGALREERKNLLFVSEGWSPSGEHVSMNQAFPATPPRIGVNPRGGGFGIVDPSAYGPNRSCGEPFRYLAATDFTQRFRDLLTRARRANLSFYSVDVGGLRTSGSGLGRGARSAVLQGPGTLRTLAENTDGIAIFNTNDITGRVRQLTDSLSAMYLLGYYSTNVVNDGKYREVRVRVKRPRIDVAARPGYFAPTAEASAAAARATPPVTPTDVDEELVRVARARFEADLYTYAAVHDQRLTVVTELSSRELSSGRWKEGADVRATVRGAGGQATVVTGAISAGARGTALTLPIDVTAGPWTVDLRVSTASQVLDSAAEAVRGAGLFSEPLVYRANGSARAPLRPAADFQFSRLERIHVEWRALRPLTSRRMALLDSKGQTLAVAPQLSDRQEDGAATLVVDLPLTSLGEGTYVFELTGEAGTDHERELLAFKVVR